MRLKVGGHTESGTVTYALSFHYGRVALNIQFSYQVISSNMILSHNAQHTIKCLLL